MSSSPVLLRVVAEDILYLRQEWGQDVEDASLRRGSTVLRRLLVEGDLQRAWRATGFSAAPSIPTYIVEPVLTLFDSRRITLASAGGAVFHGAQLSGQLMLDYAASQEEILKHMNLGLPSATLTLRDFTEGVAILVRGERVRRRHVIKYVANKLGGAHHDTKRGRGIEDQLYALLDGFRDDPLLLGKPVVYFELLSIGQAVASAPDIQQLLTRLSGTAAT